MKKDEEHKKVLRFKGFLQSSISGIFSEVERWAKFLEKEEKAKKNFDLKKYKSLFDKVDAMKIHLETFILMDEVNEDFSSRMTAYLVKEIIGSSKNYETQDGLFTNPMDKEENSQLKAKIEEFASKHIVTKKGEKPVPKHWPKVIGECLSWFVLGLISLNEGDKPIGVHLANRAIGVYNERKDFSFGGSLDFSLEDAFNLYRLSDLSYKTEDTIRSLAQRWGYLEYGKLFKFIHKGPEIGLDFRSQAFLIGMRKTFSFLSEEPKQKETFSQMETFPQQKSP